ncbi:TMEM175 family protein [Lactococcus nasutitermitis]|uniref:TMEM175 family protein n=1 Tax=Lactococcus nasutitermitis TaxID=1652957 RepID=A0ABV9JDK1_9LACT|nr:TMEM175 family protein [Lactococcus nasutitermitis]
MKRKKLDIAEYGEAMLERLKAFTDAILSIAATIMVLEIPVPKGNLAEMSSYRTMVSPLIIFVVSFLVIVSFYFETIRVFSQIKKISGWQVFAYSLFLMGVSVFPLMTRIEASSSSTSFLFVYIIYVVGISRLHDNLLKRIMDFNHVLRNKRQFLVVSYYLVIILAFAFSFTAWNNIGGIFMIWVPIRSLIKNVVIK